MKKYHNDKAIHSSFGLPPETIIRLSSDGIVIFNSKWEFEYINNSAAKLLGKKKNGIIGKAFWEVFPGAKEGESYTYYQRAVKSKTPVHFQTYSLPLKKWFEVNSYPIQNKFLIFFHDITDIKQSEMALRKSERRLRALFEKSWGVTTLLNKEGKRLYTTPSIKKVLGYSSKENIGENSFRFVHPNDIERIKKIFQEGLLHPEKSILAEYRVKNKKGEYQWLEGTMTNMLQDPDIHALVLNYHNITQRKKAEDALKKNEERFRTLIEQSADAIQLVSAEGKVIYTSDSIKRVLGYSTNEILHKSVFTFIHPDDANQFKHSFSEVLKDPTKLKSLEFRVKHKNGSWVWVEATGVNHLDNPTIQAVVGTFRDITTRKQLEAQKDEFMGIVSHELKTPVTSLKAFGQVLQQQFIKTGDYHAASLLGKMDVQINKLTTLISDLLDATKIEGGKLQFHESKFVFDDLVTEIVEELQRTTLKHDITIEGKTGKTIQADRERIGQVLINLLANAIKYSPHANKIIVKLATNKKDILCSVQDFGIGIAKEKQKKVFERFFRKTGSKENTFPGLGLGLYVSSEILKRQGGSIWVKSSKNMGSTFGFTLPILCKKVKGVRKKSIGKLLEK